MKNIPNIFTLLNLCMGSISIILILQTNESIISLQGNEWRIFFPENISWASAFLLLAAVIDFLDGFVARLFKATSEMGKQLDSLADVVSFGVAPGTNGIGNFINLAASLNAISNGSCMATG
jgi:CDP-diacylglycerol--serine O-phosphatidyltransferase